MSNQVDHESVPKIQQSVNKIATKPEQSKLIEPAVNKSPSSATDPKTVTNLENHSIINQRQNEIPSLKESPKSHKQNQPISTNPTQKSLTQVNPQPAKTNQSQQSIKKIQSIANNIPSNQTEIPLQNNSQNKPQPPSQLSKKIVQSKKVIQSNTQPGKTHKQVPKLEESAHKLQSIQKVQQPPARIKQTEAPKTKKQEEKNSKEISSSKDAEKEDPLHKEKTNDKSSQKSITEKPSDNQKQPEKPKQQHPKSHQEQLAKLVQTKVIDFHEEKSTKTLEEGKKKQLQTAKKSEKQIKSKQVESGKKPSQKSEIPQPSQGFSFNQLLKLLLQKCKQREEKQKTKGEPKSKSTQDDSLDLNLSLAPSHSASEQSQSRIKLQFKIVTPKDQKKTEPAKQSTKHEQSQSITQVVPDKKQQSLETKQKLSDIKVAFYLYNLKDSLKKQNAETVKNKPEDKESLQKKLQQVTNIFDENLYSFKVSLKDDSPQQKNKLPLKTVKFSFQPSLISSTLAIKPQNLEALQKIILSTLEQKAQVNQNLQNQDQAKKSTENKEKYQSALNPGKTLSVFIASAEFCLSSPLKNLQETKFLSLISNGFKMRLQSRKEYQTQPIRSHYLEKVFREAIMELAPSLFTEYLTSISSGSANIKFKSIQNLKKLLTRLGINQIFDETPSVKEVLKELVQVYFKTLFSAKPKSEPNQKKSDQKVEDLAKNESNGELLFLWKIISTIFLEANCNGLAIELTLYQRMSVKLTIECGSSHINKVWKSVNN